MTTFAKLLCTVVLFASAELTPTVYAINKDELIQLLPYFTGNFLINHQFPCSEREKLCFLENKILYEGDGQCYTVREQGPCTNGHVFHVDKAEASRLGGHFRGTCANICEDAFKAPLAATGECMTHSEVSKEVCRSELYLTPVRDVFGQWVCEWTRLPCPLYDNTRPKPYNLQGLCIPPISIFRREGINITNNEIARDHPLLQFFSDTFFEEREFLCTEKEKECLRYGRILDGDGNCYSPGKWAPKCGSGAVYYLDKDEAKKENGHLRGGCGAKCSSYSIEPKKNCFNYQTMAKVCSSYWGMYPTTDVFGEMVCKCLNKEDSSSICEPTEGLLPPASNPRHCKMPDFSTRVKLPGNDRTLTKGFEGPCSEEEFVCLREGKVLMNGACHTLRTRGPCGEGEELVLDKEALAYARLQPKCAPSPCLEGSVLMPIDGRCLTHKQLISLWCPDQKIRLDEFGGWECGYTEDFPANLSSTIRHSNNGTCILQDLYPGPVFSTEPYRPAAASSFTQKVVTFGFESRRSNKSCVPMSSDSPEMVKNVLVR